MEFLFLTLSAMARSISEINNHRLTWAKKFVQWLLKFDNRFNIDPYHILSNGHWILTMAAGIAVAGNFIEWPVWKQVLHAVTVWLYHGIIFDTFYHLVFMKKERRDPQNTWIIIILRSIFK